MKLHIKSIYLVQRLAEMKVMCDCLLTEQIKVSTSVVTALLF